MKRLIISALFSFLISYVNGQDLIERISVSICNRIDDIENMDSLMARINRAVPEVMTVFFENEIGDEYENAFITDTIRHTIDKVMSSLTSFCPKIREFIIKDKEARYYRMPDSETAGSFYIAGQKALEIKDYKNAEKSFMKAIKVSPDLVPAYDGLGLTYNSHGDYKNAAKYFGKSLEIFPEGSVALHNQAEAFNNLKNYQSALGDYNLLVFLYPKDTDGYLGVGKTYLKMDDYENAIDYIMFCHKIFISQNSPSVKESQTLLSQIYEKMKQQNKLDLFNKKAETFGISFVPGN